MKNTELNSMLLLRKALGICCGLLCPCSLLFGLFGLNTNPPRWYYSISGTYYANSSMCMVGLLFTTSIFFLCYKGYDWKDRLCSIVQSISAMCIIIFPCWISGYDRVGLFNIPIDFSNTLHSLFAAILFVSFAFNILFLFTLGKGEPTRKKKLRNTIYKICGIIIVAAMICMAVSSITSVFDWIPEWFPRTWFWEFFMLEPFSFAYIVKSEAIAKFNDD